jgi:hypothetical protein
LDGSKVLTWIFERPEHVCSHVGTPEILYKEPNKGTRPVTLDVEQMREEIFKDKEQETILQDEDTIVEEDFPTYSQDSQEYMHWHYKLNHPAHIIMIKMAKQNMLPRRITKILTNMDKQHTKPPMCNDCCGQKQPGDPGEARVPSTRRSNIS